MRKKRVLYGIFYANVPTYEAAEVFKIWNVPNSIDF